MKLAIMQPYFLAYLGYFQLIAAVDEFIIYDNIQYSKKGWINRNRLLRDGEPVYFSLPLKKASDQLDICARELAVEFRADKIINQLRAAYRGAPNFSPTMELLETILHHPDHNLFAFIHHAITCVCEYLQISTPIRLSSSINIDHQLKSQHKVLALCNEQGADTYINAIGGTDLYCAETFRKAAVSLKFIRSQAFEYQQFEHPFVAGLSILDVMMFNPKDVIQDELRCGYELI